MLVDKLFLFGIRGSEELKAPRHASAAATRDNSEQPLALFPTLATLLFVVTTYI